MGSRSLYRRADSTPAPSAYSLPKLLGGKITGKMSSAAYSMTGRPKVGGFDEDLARTPGKYIHTIGPGICVAISYISTVHIGYSDKGSCRGSKVGQLYPLYYKWCLKFGNMHYVTFERTRILCISFHYIQYLLYISMAY